MHYVKLGLCSILAIMNCCFSLYSGQRSGQTFYQERCNNYVHVEKYAQQSSDPAAGVRTERAISVVYASTFDGFKRRAYARVVQELYQQEVVSVPRPPYFDFEQSISTDITFVDGHRRIQYQPVRLQDIEVKWLQYHAAYVAYIQAVARAYRVKKATETINVQEPVHPRELFAKALVAYKNGKCSIEYQKFDDPNALLCFKYERLREAERDELFKQAKALLQAGRV